MESPQEQHQVSSAPVSPMPPQNDRKFPVIGTVVGIIIFLLICGGAYTAWTLNLFSLLSTQNGDGSDISDAIWIPVAQAGDKTFYSISAQDVYYKYLYKFLYTPDNRGDTYSKAPVPPADVNSLLVSTQDYRIAKDNVHVFYAGAIIEGADPRTYELIPAEKGKTYSLINENFLLFAEIGKPFYPYAKDNSGVYCGGERITGADPNTFQPILTSSDLMNVHDPGSVLTGIRIAKDKERIYVYCGTAAGVNPGEPTSALYDWTLDAEGKVDLASNASWKPDPATFVALNDRYFKDKNNVYMMGAQTKILERLVYADPSTFTVLQNSKTSEWAKDKRYVYNYGQIVSGANPITFAVSSSDPSYASDGDTLFYSTASMYFGLYKSQKGIDSPTLQVLPNGYAKDKNRVFFKALVLEGVDPATVDFLNRPNCSIESNQENPLCEFRADVYIKDKNSVFFVHESFIGRDLSDLDPIPPLAEIVQNADSATFTTVQGNGFDAQDKNHRYNQGKIIK